MNIENLENYRAWCVELKKTREELEASTVVIAVQSAAEFPYSLHTVTQDGVPPNDPHTQYLQERERILRLATGEVRRYVESLPEGRIKSMINAKYIEGRRCPSWLEIAFEFGYRDEGTPRKAIRQFLQSQQ